MLISSCEVNKQATMTFHFPSPLRYHTGSSPTFCSKSLNTTSGPQPQAMTGPQDSQTSESLDDSSRLTDLPPEILRSILEFALPQGLVLGFSIYPYGGDWPILMARARSHTGYVFDDDYAMHIHDSYGCRINGHHSKCRVYFDFALFSVNKAIATEARGKYYLY